MLPKLLSALAYPWKRHNIQTKANKAPIADFASRKHTLSDTCIWLKVTSFNDAVIEAQTYKDRRKKVIRIHSSNLPLKDECHQEQYTKKAFQRVFPFPEKRTIQNDQSTLSIAWELAHVTVTKIDLLNPFWDHIEVVLQPGTDGSPDNQDHQGPKSAHHQ